MSQAGMIMHWKKRPGPDARSNVVINALGAVATGLATLVMVIAKFSEDAWITLAIIRSCYC
jgi:hypothetical protein